MAWYKSVTLISAWHLVTQKDFYVLLRLSVEQGAMKVWSLGFRVKIVLLSQAIGSVSNGNLSVFDIISSKGREILGDDIVTIGNEELPEITPSFLRHQTSIALYSTDIVVNFKQFWDLIRTCVISTTTFTDSAENMSVHVVEIAGEKALVFCGRSTLDDSRASFAEGFARATNNKSPLQAMLELTLNPVAKE